MAGLEDRDTESRREAGYQRAQIEGMAADLALLVNVVERVARIESDIGWLKGLMILIASAMVATAIKVWFGG